MLLRAIRCQFLIKYPLHARNGVRTVRFIPMSVTNIRKYSAPVESTPKKKSWKDMGVAGLTSYFFISTISLGLCLTLVTFGLDVPALLNRLGIHWLDKKPGDDENGESKDGKQQSSWGEKLGLFAAGYALHKLFLPLRLMLTGMLTPRMTVFLKGLGFLKPPPIVASPALKQAPVSQQVSKRQ